MIIFPAIDIKNGKCVRLSQGDFNTVKVFADNPVTIAKQFQQEGATWLHVIDLDGAEKGNAINTSVIQDIIQNTTLHIQVGGGIRTEDKIIELLEIGVTRVILGSLAVHNMDQLPSLLQKYPDQIIVSVDSSKGLVTSSGWQSTSTFKTIEFCKELERIGVTTIVYTDIAKDGMMEGPNFADYENIQNETTLKVIASGGVSTYKDISRLASLNLYGAIIGKAIYLNQISVGEAIRCSQEESSLA